MVPLVRDIVLFGDLTATSENLPACFARYRLR